MTFQGVIHGHDIMDSGSGYDTSDEDFLEMSGGKNNITAAFA